MELCRKKEVSERMEVCKMDAMLVVDSYKKNAYSDKVSFDINPRMLNETPSSVIVKSQDDYNPEVCIKKTPSQEWELDVRPLISTKKWLQNYGLHKNKLTFAQILPVIGFKMAEDFDPTLKRPVSSRYAEGRFHQLMRPDGKMFNVTCGREKLRQLDARLQQAIHLYKRRLEWLTTESRRVFGVIEERAITIVLDIRNMSPQQFDLYRMALERVIYEQITQIAKFNLIRASDDIKMYQDHCVPVTHDTIEMAIKWLWGLDRLGAVSSTACVESMLRAFEDKQNEAVYLFTEGSSVDTCRQLLKEKVASVCCKPPVNVVSYNCENSDTVRFLREFAESAKGKIHVYAIIMEMDSFEGLPVDPNTNKANILLKKKTFGGIPPGAGVREDVILLFQQMEEALSELAPQVDSSMINEQYMSSCHWLAKYGLGARKLELYDALAAVAFHHRDGVVDLQTHPGEECQTDALRFKKLVNAKYCDRFPVVRWKDGKVVHVQVTPELHRTYEQKVLTALRAIQSRIDWLNQGSRALFGTLIEDQVYILIDTSESMVPSIQYVKDKLFLLMQAQVWQNRLVEVTETSLEGAWRWIQGLSCWGSTNTYAALQHALSDPGTQAIYLLTDGRPDQPPKSIIAQVQMQHSVPVHTISFNCNDTEANIFLHDLAVATGGRYHYFSDKGCDPEGQPESFESEDIRLLKEELSRGLENLDRVAELRDECSKLSWKKGIDELKSCSRAHPLPGKDRVSAVPAMEPQELYRSHTPTPPPRPGSAPPDRSHTPTPPPPKVTTSVESRSFTMAKRKTSKTRPSSARGSMKPLAAGHTRTSLLRTLNSQGSFDPEEWLLPETKQLFEKQATRQKRLAQVLEENAMSPRVLRTVSSKEWLKKNSLVAKQLTLLDALAPTLVTHKAKYVPILDKHVMAKVFDEILPIAHVSNKSRRSIKLINPQGVNLKAYEERLLRQIDIYNRRLDALVWGAVPRDLRDEEFGEEKGPVSFLNNRIWFMKALEEAQWPISSYNIILLEEEIGKAERFLQQSRDLRNITSGNKETDELSVYSDRGSVASGLSNKSKELSKSKESVSSSGSSSSSGSTSTARSKTSKCSKRSSSQYVQVLEFRESGKKKTRKRTEVIPEQHGGLVLPEGPQVVISDTESQDSNASLVDYEKDMVGLRVIACDKRDGLYYPGHVTISQESAFAMVTFAGDRRQKVRSQMIIPMSGAIPRPELRRSSTPSCSTMLRGMQASKQIVSMETTPCDLPDDSSSVASSKSSRSYRKKKQKITQKLSKKSSKGRSRNRSSSDNTTPRGRASPYARPESPVPKARPKSPPLPRTASVVGNVTRSDMYSERTDSRHVNVDEKEEIIQHLQSQLEKQKRKQFRQERRLVRQARKINKINKKLKEGEFSSQNISQESRISQYSEKSVTRSQFTSSSDTDMTPGRRKTSPDGTSFKETSNIRGSSHQNDDIYEHEEVLARWTDDGWWYRGRVEGRGEDETYVVVDATGYSEQMARDDILSENQHKFEVVQPQDFVIAPHPKYVFSFAPGEVLQTYANQNVKVEFYDGNIADLPSDGVYRVSKAKYNQTVDYIKRKEKDLHGKSVVARDDSTGVYKLGVVDSRVGLGQQYYICWLDGDMSKQNGHHIFEVGQRQGRHNDWDFVLAPVDDRKKVFLPATVAYSSPFTVEFCNGKSSSRVKRDQCFWLNQEYYRNAVEFYRSKNT
ncbi:VWA3B-like protein [Mya arenaria]|uniref:VWA3B-like protein n=1 Tax=Mya arenaria TaxID=6604 RepID=A0ABY7DTZ1_MYAAR|nr:VWA3B-like protein [Mya arenaria]